MDAHGLAPGVDLNDYPHVLRWRRMLINRPAFLPGYRLEHQPVLKREI